jgi:5-formyltetrahydrofolate cyclo-ligase
MTDLDKIQLRQTVRRARKQFVSHDDMHRLWINLAAAAMPYVSPFKTIGSYQATGSEINPALITGALQKNATIAFPRATAPATALTFHAVHALADLQPGYAAIPEPAADMPRVMPDLLLVPLIAADRTGGRLGQGQGHYDATIAALRARGSICVIGLAYECQLVDALPLEPHDQRLDMLITPSRVLQFG